MSSRLFYFTMNLNNLDDYEIPLVSIVVPCWNESKYILDCLTSIQNQSFLDFEVFVVDDCSTDNTSEIVQRFILSDPRFNYLKMSQNGGTGTALNAGFQHASGEYWTWIAGDSGVEEDFLKYHVEMLENNSNIVMAYSDWFLLENNKKTIIKVPEYNEKHLQFQCIVGPCFLFRADAKNAAGDYCKGICEDYYMHLMLAQEGPFGKIPKPLGTWRNHPDNLTNRISMKSNWKESSIAKAKARWNSAERRIAYICPEYDCAGVGWLFTNTINDYSNRYAMRHISSYQTKLNYGIDLSFNDKQELIDTLEEADIIYINNDLIEKIGNIYLFELMKRKPTIIHIHGGRLQWDLDKLKKIKEQYNCLLFGCTPGHSLLKWMPNPLPFSTNEDWSGIYSHYYKPAANWPRTSDKIKFICHHNYAAGKGVDQIREMFYYIKDVWPDFPDHEISTSDNLAYKLYDHLLLKKNVDVVIDQITQGFIGMAAWESMLQGSAVIARLDELTIKEYTSFWGSCPPILNARLIDDVAVHVNNLARSRAMVNEYGQKGREWMLENYDPLILLQVYEDYFDKIIRNFKG